MKDKALSVNAEINEIRKFNFGNHCGHIPLEPRFFNSPPFHKKRPTILNKAISSLETVYRKSKQFMNKLCTTHPNGRYVRSERREAVIVVSQVLMHYVHLSSLRIGFYTSWDKFKNLTLNTIIQKSGLNESRVKRAIKDLIKAGYLKVTRQYLKDEDENVTQGFPSIREVSPLFFHDLGMDMGKLALARDWKRKKEEKEQAKEGFKKLRGFVRGVSSFTKKIVSKVIPQEYKPLSKDIISKALQIYKDDPSRSLQDITKELQRQLE